MLVLLKKSFFFKSALMIHAKKYLRGSITELTQLTQVCHRLSKPFTFMYFLEKLKYSYKLFEYAKNYNYACSTCFPVNQVFKTDIFKTDVLINKYKRAGRKAFNFIFTLKFRLLLSVQMSSLYLQSRPSNILFTK